jgi:hypothetical protein
MGLRSALRYLAPTCFGVWLLVGCVATPPIQEMSDARQAIAAAEEAGADRFAPDEIGEARRFLQQAETDIEGEAFGLARTNALRAQDRAMRALIRSQDAAEGQ